MPRWREQPMGSDSVEPAQGQPRAIAIQVTGVDEVAGVELVQVVEDNGLTAGEVFGFAYALIIGVSGSELECHIAGGELQTVDVGSAPVSDQLKAAARFPKSARYPVGETDCIGGVGIHQVQCGVTSRRVVGGVGLAPTHLRAGTARELRRYEWAADTRSVLWSGKRGQYSEFLGDLPSSAYASATIHYAACSTVFSVAEFPLFSLGSDTPTLCRETVVAGRIG